MPSILTPKAGFANFTIGGESIDCAVSSFAMEPETPPEWERESGPASIELTGYLSHGVTFRSPSITFSPDDNERFRRLFLRSLLGGGSLPAGVEPDTDAEDAWLRRLAKRVARRSARKSRRRGRHVSAVRRPGPFTFRPSGPLASTWDV